MDHWTGLRLTEQAGPETGSAGSHSSGEGRIARRYRNVDMPSSILTVDETPDRDEFEKWVGSSDGPRLYERLASPRVGKPAQSTLSGNYLLCVWWTPDTKRLENLQQWYWREHVPQLMTVPGWLRIRRFLLVAGDGPGFLAMHDLATVEVFDDPAYGPAVETPWRNNVTAERRDYRRELFQRIDP